MPTELGLLVSDLLIESFPDLMDVKYTARLEEELDEIEEGKLNWVDALKRFNSKFDARLKAAAANMRNVKQEAIPTDEVCDKCGKPMVIRWGRFGKFMACSGYPECKNTKELESPDANGSEEEGEAPVCDKCGKPFVKKRGRFGMFWACSGYPECKNTMRIPRPGQAQASQPKPLDENCPRCGKQLVSRTSRYGPFVSCSGYPECRYVRGADTGVKCPKEGCPGWLVKRRGRRGATGWRWGYTHRIPACAWRSPLARTNCTWRRRSRVRETDPPAPVGSRDPGLIRAAHGPAHLAHAVTDVHSLCRTEQRRL